MPHNLFLHSNVVLSRRGQGGEPAGEPGGEPGGSTGGTGGRLAAEPSRLQLRLALFYTRVETCAAPEATA